MDNVFMRPGIGSSAGMLVHEATKNFARGNHFLVEGSNELAPGAWIEWLYPRAFQASSIPLVRDDSENQSKSAIETFFHRRSVRTYDQTDLGFAALSQFLSLVYPPNVSGGQYQTQAEPHQSLVNWDGYVTSNKLVLLANRVESLPYGAYLVDEQSQGLRDLGANENIDITDLVAEACFQREFLVAPAFFVVIGSIGDSLARYGERGYRYMLIENGYLHQRLYLAAAASNLAGCTTGSIVAKSFEKRLRLDGFHGSVINCFALGNLPK